MTVCCAKALASKMSFVPVGKNNRSMQTSEELLEQLKSILLEDEKSTLESLKGKIQVLEKELEEERQKKKMDSHFDEKLLFMQKEFPELFGQEVTKTIDKQIQESQDKVIDALYPIMGKLIAKFIKLEMDRLNQRIEMQLERLMSFRSFWDRIVAFFSGVSYKEMLMSRASQGDLQEVYLISQSSGLLLGKHTSYDLMDTDMLAGMLTAIKEFSKDAWQSEDKDELTTLVYETRKILIYNFRNFYLACVIRGMVGAEKERILQESIFDFCKKNKIISTHTVTESEYERYSFALKKHFHGFK